MKKIKNNKQPKPQGFLPKEGFLCECANELRNRLTKSEKIFDRLLSRLGIEHYTQLPVIVGRNSFIIDFAFYSTSLKKWFACEIDGLYHNCEEQKKKDETRDAILLSAGWIPIRMKNRDTNTPTKLAKYALRFRADDIVLKIAEK